MRISLLSLIFYFLLVGCESNSQKEIVNDGDDFFVFEPSITDELSVPKIDYSVSTSDVEASNPIVSDNTDIDSSDYGPDNLNNPFDDLIPSDTNKPTVASLDSPIARTESIKLFCAFDKPYNFDKYTKPNLEASKFGPVGALQNALKLKVDGVFAKQTKEAIISYQKENNLEPHGCIDVILMDNLLPGVPIPDYRARAKEISFLFEGTDYDQIEFNFKGADGTDDGQGITWGPTGMTLASGEIHRILKKALQNKAELAKKLTETEISLLENFTNLSKKDALSKAKLIYDNKNQRQALRNIFTKLSRLKFVRDIYDKEADLAISDKMNHYVAYLKTMPEITELDYALFYDISIQTGDPKAKVTALEKKVKANSSYRGAERRKVWGQIIASMVSSQWKKNRELRNQSFYNSGAMASHYGIAERKIEL